MGRLPSPCESARPVPTTHIVRSQLSWAGRVGRMTDTQVPKQLLCTPSFHLASGNPVDSGNATRPTESHPEEVRDVKPEQMSELTGDAHRVLVQAI